MSVLGKSDWLPEAVAKLLRTPARIEGEVENILATATPLIRLVIRLPQHVGVIERYRAVREAFHTFPAQILGHIYADARQAMLAVAAQADQSTRGAVRREIAAWDQFLKDAGTFEKIAVDLPTAPIAKLTNEDLELFREFTTNLLSAREPFIEELQAAWRQYIRVVGPESEAEWAIILKEARVAAGKLRAPIGEYGTGTLRGVDLLASGHTNRLQGLAFEAYARRCLQMLDEIDRALRLAAVKAARLGSGWQALHVNGELHLASVSPEALKEILQAGRITGDTGIVWKQFADDGVLAVKFSDGVRFAEMDASAFMELKAEGGASRLGEKLLDFHRRHTLGATKESLLLKFKDAQGKDVVGLLRPPDFRDPLTYYAVGTSNTSIPMTPALRGLGIDQRQLKTDMPRDLLRELVGELLSTAMALGSAAP